MSIEDHEVSSSAPDGRPASEQPKWRRDFPVDWPQDEYVSRRDLAKFVVLTSLAFAAGQLWLVAERWWTSRHAVQPAPEAVARVDEVPVGGAKVFSYPAGSPPRILVRTGEASFVAYDQQCTHLRCPVVPDVADGELRCPCHHGVFDLATGRPLAGPPRRALPRVTLQVRDGQVYATGVTEGANA